METCRTRKNLPMILPGPLLLGTCIRLQVGSCDVGVAWRRSGWPGAQGPVAQGWRQGAAVVQIGCVVAQERFSVHRREANRMDLAFEAVFHLEHGLARPRFPVNIDGELLTRNHPIALGDDALGHAIKALQGRRVHLVRAIREVLARPDIHLPKWFKPPGGQAA